MARGRSLRTMAYMRASSPRFRFLALLVALAGPALAAGPAVAADRSVATPVVGAPGCAAGIAGPDCRVLADPATPGDDDAAALAALGATDSPEDDLDDALRALAAATDADAAAAARAEALAILEGTPLPGRPYSGIPLLNWNAPAKVKTVPAGGTVDVREVRFPGHSMSDAWLLRFEDPSQPYTVRYRVSQLGGTAGGELRPAPLLADGTDRFGAVPATLDPLIPPALATGTFDANRFTLQRGLSGAPEASRLAEQVVEVRMPAPGLTQAILHPNTRPDTPSQFTLAPATEAREAAAATAFGFSGTTPTAAERTAAIERLADTAPERELWDDLRALSAGEPSFLDDARRIGAQDGTLVDGMRTRDALPAGTGADPDADLTVVIENGETYVSRTSLRPAAGRVRVTVVNRDGFTHPVSAIALHDGAAVLPGDDWGRFAWTPLPGGDVAARAQTTLSLDVPADAFALWLGDAETGDQAATLVTLEHGPRLQSVAPTSDNGSLPLHQAVDAAGDHWISLSGADALVHLTPAADLSKSTRTVALIPGGKHAPSDPQPALQPTDVAVDHDGMVWTTLTLGNAIARVDPSAVQDGTTAGVRVYPLPACGDGECKVVFPPEPGTLPSRQPLQMKVTEDAAGNTLVWFTEPGVERIGLLRVAPDGTQLGQTHFSCGCIAPFGLALDQAGDVWFTEGVTNAIGRLTPDVTQPYLAGAATLRHYKVPSGIVVEEPELSATPIVTSNPHSVAVDRRGLVWFTESATGKVGVLDPVAGVAGTTAGIAEFDLPDTDFGTAASPADLTIDSAGTVFWADEYGDIVGSVQTRGARADWGPGRSFRPAARRSLTDSPLVDAAGDLWFLEAGANRITRIAGVGAPTPAVAARPDVDVDLSADTLAIRGLTDATSADVVVERGGREVARAAGVAVSAGVVRVTAWPVADALRPGDVVTVRPIGAGLQAAFATELPALSARATDSAVEGTARLGARPLAGAVVDDAGRRAPIDVTDGSFRLAGASAAVTWTAATPGAAWHVRAAVAPAPAAPSPAAPSAPATPSSPAPSPTPSAAPPASDTAGEVAAQPAPAPAQPTAAPAPAATPKPAAPVSRPSATCPRTWLTGTRPAFLGMTAAAAEACLGRPVSRHGAVRHYSRGLSLELRDGRVAALVLDARGWTSAGGGLAVGAPVRSVRAALPRAEARHGTLRAVLPLAAGRVADVRITVRAGRVQRIAVRDVARARLDRRGRALLGPAS